MKTLIAALTAGIASLITGGVPDDQSIFQGIFSTTTEWNSVPVASSKGDGTFRVEDHPVENFSGWMATAGVFSISGDFDGDGTTDLALLRDTGGWTTVPMAFTSADRGLQIKNLPAGNLPDWVGEDGVNVIDGDFDGDGKTDLALIRQTSGWTTIPMAFSNGDGTFRIINEPGGNLSEWFATDGVEVIDGDFDGDGKTDLALIRQTSGWTTIPMAFSNGDGTFRITNKMDFQSMAGDFPAWAATEGVEVIDGDFDGDGKTDLALVRHTPGWTTIPMGFSNGDGALRVTNMPAGRFVEWMATEGVEVIDGDYNGDGKTDLMLTTSGT